MITPLSDPELKVVSSEPGCEKTAQYIDRQKKIDKKQAFHVSNFKTLTN